MTRAIIGVIAAAASLTLVAGCDADAGAGATTGEFPMTVQNCGRTITIDQPPQRVLTIGPESAHMVQTGGGLEKIIAHQAEFPVGSEEAFAGIRRLRDEEPPGTEAIIAERPDLVVSYGLSESNPDTLAAAGISSLVLTGMCGTHDAGVNVDGDVDFDFVYGDLELYGRLFGTSDEVARVIADMRMRVDAVAQQAAANGTQLTGAVLWPGAGGVPYGYGNASMTQTMLTTLGITNVFAEVEGFGREISKEELIDRNPDIIVLYLFGEDPEQAISQLAAIPSMAEVTAVHEGQIMAFQSTFLRPSTGVVDGLEMMADKLASYR